MANVLQELSDALAAAVAQSSPGIVRVEARRRLPATGIVWSADGLIVTANHIVEEDADIQVGLDNGETVGATLVGRDPNTDLALLRVDAELALPKWAKDNALQVGNLVLALGRPGDTVQATLGVVSAIGDTVETDDIEVLMRHVMPPGMPPGMPPEAARVVERATEKIRRKARRHRREHGPGKWGHGHEHSHEHEHEHGHGPGGHRRGPGRGFGPGWGWWMALGGRIEGAIQTDVTMYPGFSGGPLVSADGLVHGLNTSAIRGISMTVPTPVIQSVTDTLVTHGRMRRGFIGVGAQPVRLPDALADELDQETGLLIASVETGSPAEIGGLLLGDIIVALDGHAVGDLDELLALLSGDRVGKQVPVQVIRGGQLLEVNVTIGERV